MLSPSFQFYSETFPSNLKPGTKLAMCDEWMDNKNDSMRLLHVCNEWMDNKRIVWDYFIWIYTWNSKEFEMREREREREQAIQLDHL